LRSKDQIEQQNNPRRDRCMPRQAPPKDTASKIKKEDDVQGVFVIRNKKAEFVPVTTGITGTTDIEVIERPERRGRGHYRQLQDLAHAAPGSSVKIDNTAPKKEEESHNLKPAWHVQRESR
jgi:HlyD family secretion protein